MKNVCCDMVEQKSSRGDGFVMRTLYVRERSLGLYLIRLFILSQCKDLRTRVM